MTDTGGIVVERNLMVPARDGVLLATDAYRPDRPGPFPMVLERTPYDKSAPSPSERTAAVARPRSRAEVAAYFVGHGYAVAYQDCRVRYRSGGHFTKYLSEAEDGCDTLFWLKRQPWCNGRVGTFGLSYTARRVFTTAMPMCRSCIYRAGTIPNRERRWRTTSASRGPCAVGCS